MEKGKKPPIFRTLFKEHDFANIWITSLVMLGNSLRFFPFNEEESKLFYDLYYLPVGRRIGVAVRV